LRALAASIQPFKGNKFSAPRTHAEIITARFTVLPSCNFVSFVVMAVKMERPPARNFAMDQARAKSM
jgi:hypothetical protein